MSDAQASLEPDAVEPSRMPEYVRGQVLRGKYELLRPLESGGMGVVWIARDRVLNVEVALKLIQRPPSERMEFTRRALSEARLAAKLSHPAVCRATDFGLSEHGDPFVVSELLTGESLEERITRAGRMEPVEAVQILLPILDALRAAHELGIVHRDVKPGNVFLAKQWSQGVQPKLLDFGIARWVDESGAAAEGICGTPCYMSPEQARGSGDVDPRSDLWNFCATLYELCAGAPPFDGNTGAEVIAAVQSVDPPPITAYSAGDEELASIIARGLRRERDERWSSAEELTGALSRWLLARGVETDGSGRSLRQHVGDAIEGAHALPSLSPAVVPAQAGSNPSELQAATQRFWAGVLAGAALVLPLTSFQLVRAAKQPIAEEVERAPAAAPIVPERLAASTPVTPVRAADAPELTLTTLESSETSPEELAGPPPPPSTPAAIEVVPAPIEKGAPSASAVPAPAPPARASTPKRAPARSKAPSNALGYDFGF